MRTSDSSECIVEDTNCNAIILRMKIDKTAMLY